MTVLLPSGGDNRRSDISLASSTIANRRIYRTATISWYKSIRIMSYRKPLENLAGGIIKMIGQLSNWRWSWSKHQLKNYPTIFTKPQSKPSQEQAQPQVVALSTGGLMRLEKPLKSKKKCFGLRLLFDHPHKKKVLWRCRESHYACRQFIREAKEGSWSTFPNGINGRWAKRIGAAQKIRITQNKEWSVALFWWELVHLNNMDQTKCDQEKEWTHSFPLFSFIRFSTLL